MEEVGDGDDSLRSSGILILLVGKGIDHQSLGVLSHELIGDFIGYGLIIVFQGFVAAFEVSIELFLLRQKTLELLEQLLVVDETLAVVVVFTDLLGLADIKTRLIHEITSCDSGKATKVVSGKLVVRI